MSMIEALVLVIEAIKGYFDLNVNRNAIDMYGSKIVSGLTVCMVR